MTVIGPQGSGANGPDASGAPKAPLGAAIASTAGLPTTAVDALWSAGLVAAELTPQAPSAPVVAQVIAAGDPQQLALLAAAVTDSSTLDTVVRATPAGSPAWEAAAANPALAEDTYDVMAASTKAHTMLAARRASRTSLGLLAAQPDLAATVADELFASADAVVIANEIAGPRADESLAAALWHKLVGATWGAAATPNRKVRDAVLTLAAPAVRDELTVAIATNRGAPITPTLAAAIVENVDAGALELAAVTARLDGDATAWCAMVKGTALDLAATATSDASEAAAAKAKARESIDIHDSSADEAAMLLAMGMDEIAYHTVLSDDTPVDAQLLSDALNHAAIETLADWAERRLGRVPAPGDLVAHLGSLPLARLRELATELATRPDPLVCNPEVVFALPEVTSQQVTPMVARMAAQYLVEQLDADAAAWTLMAKLIDDGDEATLVELAAAARTITTPAVAPAGV